MKLKIDAHLLDWEWFSIKLPVTVVWVAMLSIMFNSVNQCIYPVGICQLYSFEPVFSPIGKPILYIALVFSALFFLAEKQMLITTLVMFLLSILVISFHESNGVFFRATIFSLVWGALFIAYFIKYINSGFDLSHYRKQFVWQMIAAVYFLAALAKLKASGIMWGAEADGFALQVVKNYAFHYYDTGNSQILDQGVKLAYFFSNNRFLTSIMLYSALILELFCFTVVFNRSLRLIFGVGLLLMHIGIAAFMGIGISVICFPMVIFFLNPLYFFLTVIRNLKNRLFPA